MRPVESANTTVNGALRQSLDEGLAAMLDWQSGLYRHLHQNPELSFRETGTARLIADQLIEQGCRVFEGVGGTGVVGILDRGPGARVALRADMDALPLEEKSGVSYASTVRAADREGKLQPVMHACGHDVHVTCLLGATRWLAEAADRSWCGSVIAIFQPAEEIGEGALGMVADGLADIVGPIDVLLGQHVMRLPSKQVHITPGVVFAGAQSLRITVHGRGAHGASPHVGVDPVVLASMIVVRLQTIVAREVQPDRFAVVTVGSLHAGASANTIPDRATLELTIRSFSETVQRALLAAIERMVRAECQASGSPLEPEFDYGARFPITENDPGCAHRVTEAFHRSFPPEQVHPLVPQSASEDFGYLAHGLNAPAVYWGTGGIDDRLWVEAHQSGNEREIPTNHSPQFAPVVESTLETGTRAMVAAALEWLAEPNFTGLAEPNGVELA